MTASERAEEPRWIGFLLIPGFALLSYACAVEPYRAANVLAKRTLYRWRHISPDGQPVMASNGVAIAAERDVGQAAEVDDLFVYAGGNPSLFADARTLAFLRREARRGTRLGGVSGGPVLLARAGLLGGYRCTVHWEHRAALAEAYPDLELSDALFEIDRDRVTASGGMAALDMGLTLIAAEHGAELAAAIADWFIRGKARAPTGPQRLNPAERYHLRHPRFAQVLARMAETVSEPVSPSVLAAEAGVSPRQLQRLFRTHLKRTPAEHYLGLRLDEARRLVEQSELTIAEIAAATGFVSPAHFSRSYRARFGTSAQASRRG